MAKLHYIIRTRERDRPSNVWQTFGRLRFEFNQAMQGKRDFSSPLVNVYGDKNDYAL